MNDKARNLTSSLTASLDEFALRWGPISWREPILSLESPPPDAYLGRLFWALSNIEDDSAYMRAKLRWARADRLTAIAQFNTMWLAEEAEHARALGAISRVFGNSEDWLKHETLSRDRRSVLGAIGVRLASSYQSGMLATYLTLGAMQEHTALTTYNAAAGLGVPSEVASVLKEISRQEGRHLRFYRKSAQAVFEHYPRARAFVRSAIISFWRPVGIDLLGSTRWKEVFLPALNTQTTRNQLTQVDHIVSSLVGKETPVMASFLRTVSQQSHRPSAVATAHLN